jgi:hypothetical protein
MSTAGDLAGPAGAGRIYACAAFAQPSRRNRRPRAGARAVAKTCVIPRPCGLCPVR